MNNNLNNNIIIGAAQLGTNYGIANSNKQFKLEERVNFLDFAYKNGFISFDTAYNYKNSHKIIGQWISIKKRKPILYSKIPKIKKIDNKVLTDIFSKMLSELNVTNLDGLFLHNPKDWENIKMQIFINKILKKKLIKSFGLSIYEENQIYLNENIKIIQAPGNIFNQKVINSERLHNFSNNGGEVHIRSIFIQGLIFMNPNNIPTILEELKKPIFYIQNYAKEINIPIANLLLLAVNKIFPKAKLVVGLDDLEQITTLLEIYKNQISDSDLREVINFGSKNFNKLWDTRSWS